MVAEFFVSHRGAAQDESIISMAAVNKNRCS